MKQTMHTTQQAHSTTEELIVSYLDGEMIRKELEVELFERLATNAEARTILREYLVVRGAIHASESDARFQLSADVDQRTRARLESILTNVPMLESAPVLATRAADRPLVQTVATDRRLKTWTKRLTPALLLLLLAVGSTWYLTHSADQRNQVVVADNSVKTPATIQTPDVTTNTAHVDTPAATTTAEATPNERIRIVKEYIPVPQAASHSGELAQNLAPSTTQQQSAPNETNDPKDVMGSHRFAKLIRNTPAVIVTQQDRL
jgi:negative regulator of sigma E activity